MKYNTTYSANVSLIDTAFFLDEIRTGIIAYFKNKYQLVFVYSPAFYLENDQKNVEIIEKTRSISFDISDEYRIGKLSLSASTYLREMVNRLNLGINSGVFTENNSIWRDVKESPVSTISKYELTFQIHVSDDFIKDVSVLAQEIYDKFLKFAALAKSTYKIQNIWPKKIPIISAQDLENELMDKKVKDREITMVIENDAYLLKNPGQILRTGHYHTKFPNGVYNPTNFYQFVFKDRVNSHVLKVGSIGEVTSSLVTDSADYPTKKNLKKDGLVQKNIKILEVKVNIPRLAMALLGKGHISEVQPGVYTEEKKVVKSKYKIETF